MRQVNAAVNPPAALNTLRPYSKIMSLLTTWLGSKSLRKPGRCITLTDLQVPNALILLITYSGLDFYATDVSQPLELLQDQV